MSALGVPTSIPRDSTLTRFEYYLGLADALACKEHKESEHLKELANSFGHDVLNLAALAGRLLWCEGVTPEIWRSHDLVGVSVDVEAYYVRLQCACDIMADCIATLGSKKGRGQVPWESFHRLVEWASRNPARLMPKFGNLISGKLPWFHKINSQRTAFVHRGKKVIIYTDRVSFNWGKLLPTLAEITAGLLKFSEGVGRAVLPDCERESYEQKMVIDGVYVPALYHLLERYRTPVDSVDLKLSAQILLLCGGYVEAAFIGYPDGFWWTVLLNVSRSLSRGPEMADITVNASSRVHDCKFIFAKNGSRYGIVACDEGNDGTKWLEGAAKSAESLLNERDVDRVVFVVQKIQGTAPKLLPNTDVPLVAEGDAVEAVGKILQEMG